MNALVAIVQQLIMNAGFIRFLFYIVLPIILYNVFCELTREILNFMLSYVSNVDLPEVQLGNWGGLASWLFCVMRLDTACSLVLTASITRFIISCIPFGPK